MADVLYRGCAIVDQATRSLAPDMAVLVAGGTGGLAGPAEEAPTGLGPGVEVVDAGGTTAIPGMVDAHSHLTMPGGSHWIDRGADPSAGAARGGRGQRSAAAAGRGALGAGRRRAGAGRPGGSLTVRDAWRGRREYPYVRAAGTGWPAPAACPRAAAGGRRRGRAARRRAAPARQRRRPGQALPGRARPRDLTLHRARGAPGGGGGARPRRHGDGAQRDAARALGSPRRRGGRVEHGFALDADVAAAMAARAAWRWSRPWR